MGVVLSEIDLKKGHCKWALLPLVQDYTVESTAAVFLLNPAADDYKKHGKSCAILKSRGYTRMYLIYLFSRIGDFSKICGEPLDELIDKRCNQVIKEIIPDAGKIFFAYGKQKSYQAMEVVSRRVEEVKKIILDFRPGAKFYCFGELSGAGCPKTLKELQADDTENQF